MADKHKDDIGPNDVGSLEGLLGLDDPLFKNTADTRPQLGGWATGKYLHVCYTCDKEFMGDKRAIQCAPCAYGDVTPQQAESE